MNTHNINIAIVGCGAVTERCHLPALQAHPDVTVKWLIDADIKRAQNLAQKVKDVEGIATDYRAIVGQVDAALIALPHSFHAPVSVELLKNCIHVLVEKPMAMSVAECDIMIETAQNNNTVLAVGLMRRFLYAGRFAKWVLDNDLLGPIESFDFREGNIYNWPVKSDFFFHKETAGGGVLFDTGAHTLDQMLWWLGDVESFQYYDDSYGGVEADCELQLTLKSGAKGIMELSRTRNLRNTAIIRGEQGELEVNLRINEVSFHSRDEFVGLSGEGIASIEQGAVKQGFADLFLPQIYDWVEAIQTGRPPVVSGTEGRRSVALIEACYAQRRKLELPWIMPSNGRDASIGGPPSKKVKLEPTSVAYPLSKEQKIEEMRMLWNELSKKSKLGYIAHLQQGESWDLHEFHLPGVRFVNRMIERFEEFGDTELSYANILEIGCGVGRFLKPLACHFKHVCGVDISEEMLKVAEKYCTCLPNVILMLNDGTSLAGLDDSSFDYCVSAGVFQHITHIDVIVKYIREAIRVLKPGGIFLFQFEGNRTEPIGRDQIGAKITAETLDTGLGDLSYKICELSIDPNDPIRNIVIVIQKSKPGEMTTEAGSSFQQHKMIERRWISGVYDDIKTKTTMHDRLQEKPKRLTFYDSTAVEVHRE